LPSAVALSVRGTVDKVAGLVDGEETNVKNGFVVDNAGERFVDNFAEIGFGVFVGKKVN
jgi:hypothetical protein